MSRRLVLPLLPCLLVLACPSPKSPDALPTTGEAFGGVQCTAVRPQTEPDLMAWDPGQRANLSRLRHHGVVAVRYTAKGCNVELEVLSNCIGKGTYAYDPYSANETKIAKNAAELFAALPVGAARLAGNLKNDRAIRTDYMLVGTASLPVGMSFGRGQLEGDCDRATHVVSTVYLGGFAMIATQASKVDATATVFGMGAGGSVASSAESLANEGSADACKTAQGDGKESTLCAVPLRIGLAALSDSATTAVPAPTVVTTIAPASSSVVAVVGPPATTVTATPSALPTTKTAESTLVKVTASRIQTVEQIHFLTGKATINADSFPTLDAIAQVLKDNAIIKLEIQGHTDNLGDADLNMKLSLNRAESVRAYLVKQGIEPSRLKAVGYGMNLPIASNATPEGRAHNRRIEFLRTDGP